MTLFQLVNDDDDIFCLACCCVGCDTVKRLQCSFNVSAGTGNDALSIRVHVPGDPTTAHMYELCRAATPCSNSIHNWNSCQLSALQKAFPVSDRVTTNANSVCNYFCSH